MIISGLFGPALEAIGVTGDSDEVLNRIANSVVNPTSQWLQPEKSDDKGMPWNLGPATPLYLLSNLLFNNLTMYNVNIWRITIGNLPNIKLF